MQSHQVLKSDASKSKATAPLWPRSQWQPWMRLTRPRGPKSGTSSRHAKVQGKHHHGSRRAASSPSVPL
eukprot:851127-Pleurochrysis_carterae.AAC.3